MRRLHLQLVIGLFVLYTFESSGQIFKQSSTPFTGYDVDDIAIQSNNNIYIASRNDGIFKTTNGGSTWINVITGSNTNVAVSSIDPNYVIAQDYHTANKSTDGGQSWTAMIIPDDLYHLEFKIGSNSIIYAILGSDYYKSTDLGNTWTTIFTNVETFLQHPSNPDILYLVTRDGVFNKSTNNGITWASQKIHYPFNSSYYTANAYISITNPNKLMIVFSDSTCISSDGGINFTKYPCDVPSYSYSSQIDEGFSIFGDPSNNNILYYIIQDAYKNMYKSTDFGITWQKVNFPSPNTISFLSDGTLILATEKGLLSSTNQGGTWKSFGYQPINYSDLQLKFVDDNNYFAWGRGSLFNTSNAGIDWIFLHEGGADYGGDGGFDISPTNSNTFVLTNGDSIGISTDGGQSWTMKKTIINDIRFVYFSRTNEQIIYATDGPSISNVVKTTNGGTSWSKVTIPLSSADNILISPTTNVAYINSTEKIIKTTDGGTTWNFLTLPTGVTYILDLIIDNSNGDLYLSDGNLFKSTDGGSSWSKVYDWTIPPYNRIGNIFIHPTNSSLLYSISGTKILASINQGNTWIDMSNQIPNQVSTVVKVFITPSSKTFISTDQGCFEGTPTLTSVRGLNVRIVVHNYSLENNFPNPFNPETNISYSLPARSRVHLYVYNILGQVVSDLVNAEQQAGVQSVVWDANVSSGLYFYRLEAVSLDNPSKRFVETKKMLLIR